MSSITIKLVNDTIVASLTKTEKGIDPVIKDGATYFRAHTPIQTGRARRSTGLKGRTIEANYPYATKLNNGYSDQAPDGMSKPTISYLNKRFDKLFKG